TTYPCSGVSAGTTAWIVETLDTVNTAWASPNVTSVARVKFHPERVTCCPTSTSVGTNDCTTGATMNRPALLPVPPGLVTRTRAVRAPGGTVASSVESERASNAASSAPNRTDVAPVKRTPPRATTAP